MWFSPSILRNPPTNPERLRMTKLHKAYHQFSKGTWNRGLEKINFLFEFSFRVDIFHLVLGASSFGGCFLPQPEVSGDKKNLTLPKKPPSKNDPRNLQAPQFKTWNKTIKTHWTKFHPKIFYKTQVPSTLWLGFRTEKAVRHPMVGKGSNWYPTTLRWLRWVCGPWLSHRKNTKKHNYPPWN